MKTYWYFGFRRSCSVCAYRYRYTRRVHHERYSHTAHNVRTTVWIWRVVLKSYWKVYEGVGSGGRFPYTNLVYVMTPLFAIFFIFFFFFFDKDHDTVHCARWATLNNKNIVVGSWPLGPGNPSKIVSVPDPSGGQPSNSSRITRTRLLRLFSKVWSPSSDRLRLCSRDFFIRLKRVRFSPTYTHTSVIRFFFFYHYYYYYYCTHLRTIIKIRLCCAFYFIFLFLQTVRFNTRTHGHRIELHRHFFILSFAPMSFIRW